jgi:hypothetical protein
MTKPFVLEFVSYTIDAANPRPLRFIHASAPGGRLCFGIGEHAPERGRSLVIASVRLRGRLRYGA